MLIHSFSTLERGGKGVRYKQSRYHNLSTAAIRIDSESHMWFIFLRQETLHTKPSNACMKKLSKESPLSVGVGNCTSMWLADYWRSLNWDYKSWIFPYSFLSSLFPFLLLILVWPAIVYISEYIHSAHLYIDIQHDFHDLSSSTNQTSDLIDRNENGTTTTTAKAVESSFLNDGNDETIT
jgi:hypothetical protein